MWSHQSSPITLMAWVDSVSDPDAQNRRVLESGGTWSQYSDPKLDALMKRIESEMNSEKRKALIIEQQHYMRETWPVAYLQMMGTVTAVSSKLAWWTPMPTDAHRFYRLNIDEK
jgi:ABC-type transport system substrate-binding protein